MSRRFFTAITMALVLSLALAANTADGKTYVVADNNEIPAALRGYVQIALDKELLQAFYTPEQGPFDFVPMLKPRVKANEATTRAYMAFALDHFRQRFVAGN